MVFIYKTFYSLQNINAFLNWCFGIFWNRINEDLNLCIFSSNKSTSRWQQNPPQRFVKSHCLLFPLRQSVTVISSMLIKANYIETVRHNSFLIMTECCCVRSAQWGSAYNQQPFFMWGKWKRRRFLFNFFWRRCQKLIIFCLFLCLTASLFSTQTAKPFTVQNVNPIIYFSKQI